MQTERKIIPIHAVRLSNSTMDLLNTCERKYQLDKIMSGGVREETPHTVFGTAFGIGVASYFIHQDKERAFYELWLAYNPLLENDKKSLTKCVNALRVAFDKIDDMLMTYEVVSFNGKPAAELSFCLTVDDDYYFVGYLDLVIRHIFTGEYFVLDVKTTGLLLTDLDPIYKNSAQLTGYSIALDAVVGKELSAYSVLYFVAQMDKTGWQPQIHILPYKKTLVDRLNWFITLGLDVERLHRMKELNTYPKRGTSCLTFNRPCYHFKTCDLYSADVEKVKEEDVIEYDFYYDLQTLIDNHVERVYHA